MLSAQDVKEMAFNLAMSLKGQKSPHTVRLIRIGELCGLAIRNAVYKDRGSQVRDSKGQWIAKLIQKNEVDASTIPAPQELIDELEQIAIDIG